jgi:hypothetical protein
VLLFALLDRDDDAPAAIDASPTAAATATATATLPAAADPCAEENLVNGFLVIPEGSAIPECSLETGQPLPTDMRVYALDGLGDAYVREVARVDPGTRVTLTLETALYSSDTDLLFAVTRHNVFNLLGRTVQGRNAMPVDFLPGPGVMVERTGSVGAFWYEDVGIGIAITYGIQLFPAAVEAGLTLRDLASRLYYVGQSTPTPTYWNPDTHEFVQTWLPPWLYGHDVAHLDAIAQGYPGADTLEPFADTVNFRCGESLPCDDGNETGTPQEAVLVGTCDGFTPRPASERTIFSGPIQPTVGLFGVARQISGQLEGVEYVVYFLTGHQAVQMLASDEGIVGLTPLCPLSDLVRWAVETETWLRAPSQNIDP